MLDKAPADSGSRERALGWLFEELQLDEVMVFVAKLVTFLVVCGICSDCCCGSPPLTKLTKDEEGDPSIASGFTCTEHN